MEFVVKRGDIFKGEFAISNENEDNNYVTIYLASINYSKLWHIWIVYNITVYSLVQCEFGIRKGGWVYYYLNGYHKSIYYYITICLIVIVFVKILHWINLLLSSVYITHCTLYNRQYLYTYLLYHKHIPPYCKYFVISIFVLFILLFY